MRGSAVGLCLPTYGNGQAAYTKSQLSPIIREGGLSDWGQAEVVDRSIACSATVEKRSTDSRIYDGDFVTTKYKHPTLCTAETLVAD
jgi:hypothetical protein